MHVEDVGGCWAWTVLSMETAQLHPCRKLTGEPEFAHDSGLDGYLRLGVLTTYGGYWPCLPTSRDRTSLILVATRSFSGQLCCKVLSYMKPKTASQCPTELPPQPCRDSRKGPSSPSRFLSTLGCSAPLASHSVGTPYPPWDLFWNMSSQSPLVPSSKFNWPLSPPKAKRRRASHGTRP